MRLQIVVEPKDVEAVKRVVQEQANHEIVLARNTLRKGQILERGLWRAMLMCLLTTQNKSGRGSVVDSFLRQRPFPLTAAVCRAQGNDLEPFVYSVFESENKRMRRWKLIATAAAHNFAQLEDGRWPRLIEWAERLGKQRSQDPAPDDYRLEREAAIFLQEEFQGFGPKQSRNFWQSLGLTRFEIPLDSRISKWCKRNLGIDLPSGALADEQFYELLMDAFRDLCGRAGVWPSVFDGAVFASFESDATLAVTTAVWDDSDELE